MQTHVYGTVVKGQQTSHPPHHGSMAKGRQAHRVVLYQCPSVQPCIWVDHARSVTYVIVFLASGTIAGKSYVGHSVIILGW